MDILRDIYYSLTVGKTENGLACLLSVISSILLISNVMSKEASAMSALKISSPAFRNNGGIPVRFTCDGANVNPALLIENVPANTKSLALIVDDPDAPAGTFVHWLLWNIDPATKEIRENLDLKEAKQGLNDFRSHNYGGPCPPSGTHRYFFKLYALDTALNLSVNSTRAYVEKAMEGHVIEQAQITGQYKRR